MISRLAPTRVAALRKTAATLAIGRVAILPRFFSTALTVMAPISRHSPKQPMLVRVLTIELSTPRSYPVADRSAAHAKFGASQ